MKIDVTNLQDVVRVNRVALRRAARAALGDLMGCYSIVLVDDEQMREVNRKHLSRDGTTDVIAFPFEGAPLSKDDCAGEIIICADVAASEARGRGLQVEAELALYVVHGALHLAGFDDLTRGGAAEMHRREKEILAGLGYEVAGLWKPLGAARSRRRERS